MIRTRLRSPLRWLSAVMSALMILAIASIIEAPVLMLAAPVVAAIFLLAPPLGVYRHDETPTIRSGVHLEAVEARDEQGRAPTHARFTLVLINEGDVTVEDVRLRILIPHTIVPAEVGTRPLGALRVGTFGEHWFLDSMIDATAVTFRATPRGGRPAAVFPPGSRVELADLVLPGQSRPFNLELDYQVTGSNVKTALERLRLRSGG